MNFHTHLQPKTTITYLKLWWLKPFLPKVKSCCVISAACVNLNSYFLKSNKVSLSCNSDLKLFLFFVYHILSVNEGVFSGFKITSVWLLNWQTVHWLIMSHSYRDLTRVTRSTCVCVSAPFTGSVWINPEKWEPEGVLAHITWWLLLYLCLYTGLVKMWSFFAAVLLSAIPRCFSECYVYTSDVETLNWPKLMHKT